MAYITGECLVLSAGSLAQLPYDDKSAGEGVGERVRPAAVGRATRTGSVMGPGSEVSSLISRHVAAQECGDDCRCYRRRMGRLLRALLPAVCSAAHRAIGRWGGRTSCAQRRALGRCCTAQELE